MYLVQCISAKGASVPKKLETLVHETNNWLPGQVDYVDDAVIAKYQKSTDVFTVIGRSGAAPSGLSAITGLSAIDNIAIDGNHQTVFTFAAMAQTVTVALKYASQKIFTFPQGRISINGLQSDLTFAVVTNRASTIIGSAALTYGLGSAAASNVTLSTTMQDELPVTSKTLTSSGSGYTTASKAALAIDTQWDGTTTALPMYLNTSFVTGTDILADGILNISGTFTLSWQLLGNN